MVHSCVFENPFSDGRELCPLLVGDPEVLVRHVHRATRVSLRTSSQVAHQLRYQEFEAAALLCFVPSRDLGVVVECRANGFVHPRVH